MDNDLLARIIVIGVFSLYFICYIAAILAVLKVVYKTYYFCKWYLFSYRGNNLPTVASRKITKQLTGTYKVIEGEFSKCG